MRLSWVALAVFAVAASGEQLRRLPGGEAPFPSPQFIDTPAQEPVASACETTFGIVQPCKTTSPGSAPSLPPSKTAGTTLTTSKTPPPTISTNAPSPKPTATNTGDTSKACFSTNGTCGSMFYNITSLYNILPENKLSSQSNTTFQSLFCNQRNRESREVLFIPSCRKCTDVDTRTRDMWNTFEVALQNFCATSPPTIYTLSKDILAFVKGMVIDPLGISPAGLSSKVEKLVGQWEALGVSVSTILIPTLSMAPGTTPGTTAIVTSTKTITNTNTVGASSIPRDVLTKGLSQLPHAWPYTKGAGARRPGQTASFTVTKAEMDGGEEFVVVEEMVWFPRPLDGVDFFNNFTRSAVGYGNVTFNEATTGTANLSSATDSPASQSVSSAKASLSLTANPSVAVITQSLESKSVDGVSNSSVSRPASKMASSSPSSSSSLSSSSLPSVSVSMSLSSAADLVKTMM